MKMRILSTLILTIVSLNSFASENRDESNDIFEAKNSATLVEQAMLGVGEYILSNTLHVKEHGLVPLNQMNINQDEKLILGLSQQLNNPNLPELEKQKILQKIEAAQQDIEKRHFRTVIAEQQARNMSPFLKKAVVVGQIVLITDLFGRVYVYHTLNRDPGVSPVGKYLLQRLK